MKTPREILLERHQAAVPKLDTIRRKIVDAEFRHSNFAISILIWPMTLWRELIFPSRRIWTGLAAIWILLFIFDFSQRDQSGLMAKNISPSPEMILTFRQQERLLAELIGPDELRATEPPKVFSPQPRSECVEILTT